MFEKITKWYDRHFNEITWFFIGYFTLDLILSLAKRDYIDVVVDIVFIAMNFYLYQREKQ